MATVLILRGTIALGQHQAPGQVVNLPDNEATILVALGKASYTHGTAKTVGESLESLVQEQPAKKGRK